MKCTDNLDKCKASCCKVLPFYVKSFPGDIWEDYYIKHGLEFTRISRTLIKVLVPYDCKQLDESNLCKLHGSEDKPSLCKALNEKTATNYHITDGCIYKKGEKNEG